MDMNKTRAHYETQALMAEMMAALEEAVGFIEWHEKCAGCQSILGDKARAVLAKVK